MRTNRKVYGFDPDYAIAPGETLKETMESLGMSQKELAARTGLTVQSLNRIFKGEQPINYETAGKLELVTGVPARFWNDLEAQYREQLEKIRELKELDKNATWLKLIPIAELQKRGLIGGAEIKNELIRETLKFFGVSSVSAWEQIWTNPKVAARRSSCFETRPGYAAAWIRQGEISALKLNCKPFNKNKFKDALLRIRGLTTESPDQFIPKMIQLCSDSGVALALVPEMQKVPWSGATKWIHPQKAMVIINLRGKREDKFWFSFFHEAGHVLNDNKKNLYINDNSDDPVEERANKFATSLLFPKDYKSVIPTLRSKQKIISYANKTNLSCGIVAGQYQFLTNKWGWYNDMIRKFVWAD
ncbi:MAG: helix-turn-helix domain-containing protein [Desulfobacteraceae bacterium]|jgi:addiction module HigA family antidote